MTNRMRRILYLNSTFPPHTLGGGPRIAGWLVDGLRAQGHVVEGLCAVPPEPIEDAGMHRVLLPVGDWERGRPTDWMSRVRQCLTYRIDQFRSRDVLASFRPDVIVGEGFYNISHAAWVEAEARRIPTIFFPVASYSPEQLFTSWGRLEKMTFPLTGWMRPRSPDASLLNALVTPSEFLLKDYLAHGIGARQHRVIPLGIPTNQFRPSSSAEPSISPSGPWKILWLSRITQGKGYDVALDAFSKLRARHGNSVQLTIAGFSHPDDERRLLDEIRARHLDGEEGGHRAVTRLKIPLDDDRGLIECYRSHHVYWLTSLLPEALSLSLLEAMACGTPVIATRVGGNVDIIDKSRGVIGTTPGDSDMLVEHTGKLLEDDGRRRELAASGCDYARKYHSLEAMARNFTEVIDEVVDRAEH